MDASSKFTFHGKFLFSTLCSFLRKCRTKTDWLLIWTAIKMIPNVCCLSATAPAWIMRVLWTILELSHVFPRYERIYSSEEQTKQSEQRKLMLSWSRRTFFSNSMVLQSTNSAAEDKVTHEMSAHCTHDNRFDPKFWMYLSKDTFFSLRFRFAHTIK